MTASVHLSRGEMDAMSVGFSANMLWLDLEFTDLHKPGEGQILEVAARITTSSLGSIPSAHVNLVVSNPDLDVARLNPFCRDFFTRPRAQDDGSSLVELCQRSTISLEQAEAVLVDLVDTYRGNQQIQLCGSTIRKDLEYIERHMPGLAQRIHYQLKDVTSQLSETLREFPAVRPFLPARSNTHCAMDDVNDSLRLSRWISAMTKRDFLQLPSGQIIMRTGPSIASITQPDEVRASAQILLLPTESDSTGTRPFSTIINQTPVLFAPLASAPSAAALDAIPVAHSAPSPAGAMQHGKRPYPPRKYVVGAPLVPQRAAFRFGSAR